MKLWISTHVPGDQGPKETGKKLEVKIRGEIRVTEEKSEKIFYFKNNYYFKNN